MNRLANSNSPYLRQHAHNPVDWYPWGKEALEKARAENKLIIISIGYSSCHWCHVMEKESFEDEDVAAVMNKFFVSIKVDREERPDIDQVYMDAVQLMTGRGGWPLNVVTLPDQRPLYGGTYFPREQWMQVLLKLAAFYREDPSTCNRYADELTEGVNRIGAVALSSVGAESTTFDYTAILDRWSRLWDNEEGGPLRSPKFPMPDSYRFLLAAADHLGRRDALEHVYLTLDKMGLGGIMDQIGGGFYRYSTDMNWKVPHFEKMLYDNAFLVSLYADAFKQSGKVFYREVIEGILNFVKCEMTSPSGGLYSALDADSEGVEGRYYCWNPDELSDLLGEDAELAVDYFNINPKGYWEHDRYIPLREVSDEQFAHQYGISKEELRSRMATIRNKMMLARAARVRPGLDDKIICSWNAMMITAFLDAWSATGDENWLLSARRSMAFLQANFLQEDRLLHCGIESSKGIEVSIHGFLDDYAFFIEALLRAFSMDMDENALDLAIRLTRRVFNDFSDEHQRFFWFTPLDGEALISRKQEVGDNVIPSSNAVMAHNLLKLFLITGELQYVDRCRRMISALSADIESNTSWYSRWARVAMELNHGSELVICGTLSDVVSRELHRQFLPLTTIAATSKPSSVDIFKNRYSGTGLSIFYCQGQSCHPPVKSINELAKLMKSSV